MSLWLLILAAVTTVNAPRLWSAGASWRWAAAGASVALAALAVLATLADPILDGLEVSAPTARMAAGILLLITGGLVFSAPPPSLQPASRWPWMMPLAFPLLLTPGLAVLTLSASVDQSAPVTVLVLAGALATFPALALVRLQAPGGRAMAGLGQALAGILVLAGLALLMDGVFDI